MAATDQQLDDNHAQTSDERVATNEHNEEVRARQQDLLDHRDAPPDPSGGPDVDSGYEQPRAGRQDPSTVRDVVDPPPVPATDGTGPENGEVAVDTSTFAQFATNLRALREMIDTSNGYVNAVNVRAGNFGAGYRLGTVVNLEEGGLRADTFAFMKSTYEVLFDVEAVMTKLAADYDSVEEINGISGNDLAQLFQEPYDGIGGLQNLGTSDSGSVGNPDKDPETGTEKDGK